MFSGAIGEEALSFNAREAKTRIARELRIMNPEGMNLKFVSCKRRWNT